MDILLPILLGFGIAFVGSMPIAGPLAVLVVRRATEREYRSAFFVTLGGALAEALVALVVGITFPLLGSLVANVVQLARGVGAAVLLAAGLLLLVRPQIGSGVRPRRRHTSIFVGMAAAGMNPTIVATWLLVLTSLYGVGWLSLSYTSALLFALGVLGGVVAWFSLLLLVGERLEHVITPARREILMRVLGIAMIAASVYLVAQLFRPERAGDAARASLRLVPEDLGGQMLAQLVDHQLLDRRFLVAALGVVRVLKLDAHSGGIARGRLFHLGYPDHLAGQAQRLFQVRDAQREDELGADRQRSLGADEGAAARDVLRVIGEERVDALVLDLELDRCTREAAAVGRVIRGAHRHRA